MADNITFLDASSVTKTHASKEDTSQVHHPVAVVEYIAAGGQPQRVGLTAPLPVTSQMPAGTMVDIGAQADTAATTDGGAFSLIALFKRMLGKMPGFGQTTMALSPTVNIASDQSVIPCGGNTVSVTAIPTITASSAYATGNTCGALLTFANATRIALGSGVIQAVTLNSKSNQTFALDVVFLTSTPGSSTITDKTAIAINTADFDKVIGSVAMGSWTSLGTPSVALYTSVNLPFKLPSGTSLFAVIVSRGTPTFTATSDLSLTVRILQD